MGKSLVYTKTGDDGTTGLIGGTRVKKCDDRLNAYGTVDELNSNIGMIRSYPLSDDDKSMIVFIQNKLFSVGGYLATDQEAAEINKATIISGGDIMRLENRMDMDESNLPKLTKFVLPGGSPQVSAIHISRTVCRRAERMIITLQERVFIDASIVKFINRLSDYLFVLSRKISADTGADEITWDPS